MGRVYPIRAAHRRHPGAIGLAGPRPGAARLLPRRPPPERVEPVARSRRSRSTPAALRRRHATRVDRLRFHSRDPGPVRLRALSRSRDRAGRRRVATLARRRRGRRGKAAHRVWTRKLHPAARRTTAHPAHRAGIRHAAGRLCADLAGGRAPEVGKHQRQAGSFFRQRAAHPDCAGHRPYRPVTTSPNGSKMNAKIEFPAQFLWGSATLAYQVEGSPLADGAGPSIWQRFCHTPNMVRDGDNGDIACDHYRRYREDVALMSGLGLNAYRFSIAWSRVVPTGRGAVNQAGLDFYERLVDTLLKHDIEPMVTLFHWDLPAALDDRGGWLNPDIAEWFAEYGNVMYRALDGRVKKWVTHNEPWVVTDGGYLHGALAPGHSNRYEAPIASHNMMRAHGKAVQAYRAIGKHEIGLVVNIEPKYAASDSAADAEATARADAYMNR